MEDGSTDQVPRFHFIRDDASDIDQFQSHTKIAAAIGNAIIGNSNLKTIGVLGRWGSGKSTVVKNLETYMEGADTVIATRFFYYDAWVHQSDPPRRSFLEAFLKFLMVPDFDKGEKWQLEMDKLNGSVKDETVTTTPTLTLSGLIASLSLLCVPLGMKLLTEENMQKAFKAATSWQVSSLTLFGYLLMLAPFIAAIGLYVKKALSKDDEKRFHSPFAILVNKVPETKKTRIVRDVEPSAIEFQKLFGELLEDGYLPGVRTVLVIDNLDRLHETEALAMWTTIRSFFLGLNQKDKAFERLPVVILPIDEEAVGRLYGDRPGEIGTEDHLGQLFMDKTFDLTFRVPPPVQSDWSNYLAKRLAKVFGPGIPKSWIDDTCQIFESSRERGEHLTPRGINVTVNAIATLWLERKDDGISFANVALFVIFRPIFKNNVVKALGSQAMQMAAPDQDWARSIAALHYGVSLESALQVLVEDQLRAGIRTITQSEFATLAKTPGFGGAFVRLIKTNNTSPVAILPINAANLLATVEPSDERWVSESWNGLRRMLVAATGFEAPTAGTLTAINYLIAYGDPAGLPDFLSDIPVKLSELSFNAARSRENSEVFLEIIEAIFRAADQFNLDLPPVTVNTSVSDYLLINDLAYSRKRIATMLLPTNPNDIPQDLSNTLKSGDGEIVSERFLQFESRREISNWTPLMGTALEICDLSEPSPALSAALQIVGRLANSIHFDATTIDRMNLAMMVRKHTDAGNASVLAIARLCALALLYGNEHALNGSWERELKDHPGLPELIKTALDEFGAKNDALVRVARSAAACPEFLPVARILLTDSVRDKTFSKVAIAPLLEAFPALCLCLEPMPMEGLFALSKTPKFWGKVAALRTAEAKMDVLRAYLELVPTANLPDLTQTVMGLAKGLLHECDHDAWMKTLAGKSSLLEMSQALFVCDGNLPPESNQKIAKALDSSIVEMTQIRKNGITERWFRAARLIGAKARNQNYKILWAQLPPLDILLINEIFRFGGPPFIEACKRKWAPDQWVRRVISNAFGDLQMTQALSPFAWFHGEMINQCSPETFQHLNAIAAVFTNSLTAAERKTFESVISTMNLRRKLL